MSWVGVLLQVLGFPTCFGGLVLLGFTVVFGLLAMAWVWKPKGVGFGNSPSAPYSPVILASVTGNPADLAASSSMSNVRENDGVFITDEDLGYLHRLVVKTDGGPAWNHVMDRSTNDMSYQCWQRDQETGPPQYYSRTVYENATPELLRDFFWDDEFRLKWDNMLVNAELLEECPATGMMAVHWIRKFPFFCSDREYIIGRRIWESRGSYYTVTKGVPCLSVPRKDKPRRVDLYYSSWFIQSVESQRGDGQLSASACEVRLFHYEDMGIPWEVAKFGVRQGMWGAVRNIERGFRAYQKHRESGASLSHHVLMARINTKANLDNLMVILDNEESSETESPALPVEKRNDITMPKLLIFGGAVLVACTLNQGLLSKAFIFGIARRLGNIGRGAVPHRN